MTVRIECVTEDRYPEIYTFEQRNKLFFESFLPPRNEGYYRYDTFTTIMDSLMLEQNQGEYYMYLIRDENNSLVGRINLQLHEDEAVKKAEVGYRIAVKSQGLGYASQALALIVKKAFKAFQIEEMTAGTAKENHASRRVLEKNGFKKIGQEANVLKINGKWVDGVLYSLERSSVE